jgi:hypothetical protein
VAGHLGEDEKVKEFHAETDDNGAVERIVAVTNQRLIRFRRNSTGREVIKTKTVLLHGSHILGTRIEKLGDEEPHKGEIGLGIFLGLFGLIMMVSPINPGGGILAIGGFLAIIIGLLFIIKAVMTEKGQIELEVIIPEDNETVVVPHRSEDVVKTASEVVANTN